MSEIEQLIDRYSRFVQIPWSNTVSGAERVWMFVYQPRDERRLRARVTELEIATKGAGHAWELVDLTDSFAEFAQMLLESLGHRMNLRLTSP